MTASSFAGEGPDPINSQFPDGVRTVRTSLTLDEIGNAIAAAAARKVGIAVAYGYCGVIDFDPETGIKGARVEIGLDESPDRADTPQSIRFPTA